MNERTSENIVCLRRISSGNRKYAVIPLQDKKVVVGRSLDATFNILSDKISRQHAILSENENGDWVIMDNKSLNGVLINDVKLKSMEARVLKDGDTVQFGLKTNDHAYVYKFCRNSKMNQQVLENGEPSPKRPRVTEQQNAVFSGPSTSSSSDFNGVRTKPNSNVSSRSSSPQPIVEHSYCTATFRQTNSDNQSLNTAMDLSSTSHTSVNDEEADHRMGYGEPSSSCSHPGSKRSLHEMSNKETLMLKKKLEEMERLIAQKDAELNRLLQDKHNNSIVEDADEVKVIPLVDITQEVCKVEDMTQEQDVDQQTNKGYANIAMNDVCDKVETELTCSICSELFIQSVTLNCAHSFCQYCIKQWKTKCTLRPECPMCRAVITSETRSLSVDSVISVLLEQMNDEAKLTRREVIEERQMLEAKASQASASIKPISNIRPAAAPILSGPPVPRPYMHVQERFYDQHQQVDVNLGSENDAPVRGRSYHRYGGWGRCFRCGHRGHWARGCPF